MRLLAADSAAIFLTAKYDPLAIQRCNISNENYAALKNKIYLLVFRDVFLLRVKLLTLDF